MGGSSTKTTQKVQYPQYIEDAMKLQLDRASAIAEQGYVPYQGPEVAAFTPQQVDAMQQSANWSAAFGGAGAQPMDVASTLPQAQRYADGTTGYSSFGGYLDQLAALKSAFPGQFEYIKSFAIDPVTGGPGGAPGYGSGYGSGSGSSSGYSPPRALRFPNGTVVTSDNVYPGGKGYTPDYSGGGSSGAPSPDSKIKKNFSEYDDWYSSGQRGAPPPPNSWALKNLPGYEDWASRWGVYQQSLLPESIPPSGADEVTWDYLFGNKGS